VIRCYFAFEKGIRSCNSCPKKFFCDVPIAVDELREARYAGEKI